jgi:hypothetical protein
MNTITISKYLQFIHLLHLRQKASRLLCVFKRIITNVEQAQRDIRRDTGSESV